MAEIINELESEEIENNITTKKIHEIFMENGFDFARCFGSKTMYYKHHPHNFFVPNCRIYMQDVYEEYKDTQIKDWFDGQKLEVWYGDIDFTRDMAALHKVAMEIGTFTITNEIGSAIITIYGR